MADVIPFRADRSWYIDSMERLVDVVQELSHARTVEDIAAISPTDIDFVVGRGSVFKFTWPKSPETDS